MASKTVYNPITSARLSNGRTQYYLTAAENADSVQVRVSAGITANGYVSQRGCVASIYDGSFTYRVPPVDVAFSCRMGYTGPGIGGTTPGGQIISGSHNVLNVPIHMTSGLTVDVWNDCEDDDMEISLEVTYTQ